MGTRVVAKDSLRDLIATMTSAPTANRSTHRSKTGGRAAGTPNKITIELRETILRVLESNADNIDIWLHAVAEGDPTHCRAADPARALDIVAKLAEFAVPKLARVECAGAGNVAVQATAIKIEFVDAPAQTSCAR